MIHLRSLTKFLRNMSTTTANPIRIGTHNGSFHCDEAFACVLLKILPEYSNAQIVRTRDPKLLAECDIVVDVGGVFDPAKKLFDHHQRTFIDTFHSLDNTKPWTIRLSSAGLIYVHFGRQIIRELLNAEPTLNEEERKRLNEVLYDKLYENFVQEIDAIDNGVDIGENMKYKISTNLSSRVSHLAPAWNEENQTEKEELGFNKAMDMIRTEFLDRFYFCVRSWWPARSLLEKAIEQRFDVDPSGSILRFDRTFPWIDHLFDIEAEQKEKLGQTIKFILFPDTNGSWRIRAVPLNRKSFENRLSLLKEFLGLRDNELSQKTSIPGCIFVHASGFIGGNATYEGALAMAKYSLEH